MPKNKYDIKKEVSCRILTPYFYLLKEKGITLSQIMHDIPYEQSYLLRRSERIEWSTYCRLIRNMRLFFSPADFEEVGTVHVKKGFYPEGVLAGFIFFSSNKISRMLTTQIFRIGKQMFACVKTQTEYPDKNKIRVIIYLDEEYEFLPEFFLLTKGTWEQLGKLVGHKKFKIDLNWIQRGAVYNISWEKEHIFYKIKRGFRWLFSIRKAFSELTDSHQQLLEQYEQLEESQKLLQKQTTRLKAAYNISRSIRKSLHIESTMKAIASALVKNAGFPSAEIFLFRDIEGNKLNITVSEGTHQSHMQPVYYPMIVNNQEIGKITVYSRTGTSPSDRDDLMDYLLPVITISIHDSLVLRAVTDYKNNLELKVEERTSELSKTQEILSHTIDLLREAQQTQNRFFTNISHEFRTPLTLIIGPALQIIDMTHNEKITANARLITRSAKKLNHLASQLLDISRIEAGHMKLKVSPQNIVPVVCDQVSSFQSFAERKKIVLQYRPEPGEIMLFIDRDKFDKIIGNLLSNAVKFTPEGGTVKVEVKKGTPGNRFASISVYDTGIGIPKEKIGKIFDRFYQVDNRISKEFEGTGIGLSLTRELTELHKGKIIVESEDGKGSTFTVLFPEGEGSFSADEILCDKAEEIVHPVTEPPLPPALTHPAADYRSNEIFSDDKNPCVLIIEDNSELRRYIKDILDNKYNVIEAEDGEEGLKKSTELMPDLIISDIMMPGLDGLQLCARLKSDPETSHIPLIFLTAKAALKDKIEGLETGADDYIMKPFEPDELKIRIKNILDQKSRLHDYFRKHGLLEIDTKQVTPVDRRFLREQWKPSTHIYPIQHSA